MTDAVTSSMQDYLETMLTLSEMSGEIRVTDIAGKLNIAKASVSQAIANLKDHGLVKQDKYGPVELTVRGKEIALEVRMRHRQLKAFLVEVLGVDQKIAENDACLMEHVVSAHTMNRLMEYLNNYSRISGGEKIRVDKENAMNETEENQERKQVNTLDKMNPGQHGTINKVVSDKNLKSRLLDMGITAGRDITVIGKAPLGDPIEIDIMGYNLTLRKSEAAQIFVEVNK